MAVGWPRHGQSDTTTKLTPIRIKELPVLQKAGGRHNEARRRHRAGSGVTNVDDKVVGLSLQKVGLLRQLVGRGSHLIGDRSGRRGSLVAGDDVVAYLLGIAECP